MRNWEYRKQPIKNYRIDPHVFLNEEASKYFKRDCDGYVYLVKADNLYKIGMSSNPEKRMETLRYRPPYPTKLIHAFRTPQCRKDEWLLHIIFRDKRVVGEWFILDEDDIAWIKTH